MGAMPSSAPSTMAPATLQQIGLSLNELKAASDQWLDGEYGRYRYRGEYFQGLLKRIEWMYKYSEKHSALGTQAFQEGPADYRAAAKDGFPGVDLPEVKTGLAD